MPWKEHGVMEERFRFVVDWKTGDWTMAELCRLYGVSRVTGYKWVDRYETGGLEALRDQSRAPHDHPNAVAAEMEDLVIGVREKHPSWGAAKIRARLEGEHGEKQSDTPRRAGGLVSWTVSKMVGYRV